MLSLAGVSATASDYPSSARFDDVQRGDWFYHDTWIAYIIGITRGVSENPPLFAPLQETTRAEFVTMLGRTHEAEAYANGTIEYNKGQNPYVDIDLSSFYAPYVLWATERGIVQGDGLGHFRPSDPITRQEMAVMLYRYIYVYDFQAYFPPPWRDLINIQYVDRDAVAVWAVDAAEWLGAHGVVNGVLTADESDHMLRYFKPNTHLIRAEAVALLIRVAAPMGPIFYPMDGLG